MGQSLRKCLVCLSLCSAASTAAEVDGGILDAAARIDYGWMTADPALIAAAADAVAARDGDAWAHYLNAYAAFRSVLLLRGNGDPVDRQLGLCLSAAERAAGFETAEAEARVLLAACAALAAREQPLRAVLHQRRVRQQLERVAELDPENPRYQLISLQYVADRELAPQASPASLLAAFAADSGIDAFPDWGEVEALVLVAEASLERGDIRAARDLLEEALLIAPDFNRALSLQQRLSESAAAE